MIILPKEDGFKISPSGLYLPGDYKPHPIAFDFFAGCGGFSCGLVQAGWDVVGALEYDPSASHTYMVNLCAHPVQIHYTSDFYRKKLTDYFEKAMKNTLKKGGLLSDFSLSGSGWIKSENERGKRYPAGKNFFFGDIKEITGKQISAALGLKIGDLDCVVGGPPCQGFSTAGKRDMMDPRNSLVFEYARLICELQPKTFVMENVPGIVTMRTPEGVPVIHQFMRILEDGNYMTYEAAKEALGIREKEIGYKPKYVVKTAKTTPGMKKEEPKQTAPAVQQIDIFK